MALCLAREYNASNALSDNTSGDNRLGWIVVELHREAEHQGVEIAVLRCEVEAEDMPGLFDGVGFLAGLDRDVAEEAGLGGVGEAGDLAICRWGMGTDARTMAAGWPSMR